MGMFGSSNRVRSGAVARGKRVVRKVRHVWGDIPDFVLLGWNGAALAARGERPLALLARPPVSGTAGVKEGESTFNLFLALDSPSMSLRCCQRGPWHTTDLSD